MRDTTISIYVRYDQLTFKHRVILNLCIKFFTDLENLKQYRRKPTLQEILNMQNWNNGINTTFISGKCLYWLTMGTTVVGWRGYTFANICLNEQIDMLKNIYLLSVMSRNFDSLCVPLPADAVDRFNRYFTQCWSYFFNYMYGTPWNSLVTSA